MQSQCVIKFIGVSIQTLSGGQDDMQVLLQGSTENNIEKDGTAGEGPAVARFKTNGKRERFVWEKLKVII